MSDETNQDHPLYTQIIEELIALDRRDFLPKREGRLARMISLFSQPEEDKTEVIF